MTKRKDPNTNTHGGKRAGSGRQPGSRNLMSLDVKQAVLYVANHVGMDGKGFGGMHGYLTMLAIRYPAIFGGMIAKMLPMVTHTEVEHTFDLTKLNHEELATFERIIMKSRVPLITGPVGGDEPLDYSDGYKKRLSELMLGDEGKTIVVGENDEPRTTAEGSQQA